MWCFKAASGDNQHQSASAGFTLVEVMLALAIFAMAAVAALQVASQQASGLVIMEERSFATMVAANRLAWIQVQTEFPPENNEKGSMEFADRTWWWEQQVTETVTPDLREVTIIVRLQEDGQEQARLSSFVGRR